MTRDKYKYIMERPPDTQKMESVPLRVQGLCCSFPKFFYSLLCKKKLMMTIDLQVFTSTSVLHFLKTLLSFA